MSQTTDSNNRTAGRIALLMAVGFIIDVGQAIIIYNSGKKAEALDLGMKYKWQLPKGKELLKTAGIVLATSLFTGLIVELAERALYNDNQVANTTKKDKVETT